MPKKKKSGGARPGAGRPKVEQKKVQFSVHTTPETKIALDHAVQSGKFVSRGAIIDALAKRLEG